MKKWLGAMFALNAVLVVLCAWLLTRPNPNAESVLSRSHSAKNHRGTDRAIAKASQHPIIAPSVMAKAPAETANVPTSAEQSGTTADATPEKLLRLPASIALQSPDIPLTTDQQVAEWEQLQDAFLTKVNSSIPSTDAAREAWDEAQRENDDLFRAKFGDEALQRQQMEAYKQDLEPAQP